MFKFVLMLVILAMSWFPSLARSVDSGDLVIEFTGFKNQDGQLVASLVDSADRFLAKDLEPLRQFSARIDSRTITWTVRGLPFGDYAISAYHDDNDNAELDSALFGIPLEVYGFSNNVRSGFGSPDFEDAVFRFDHSDQHIEIRLR